MDAAIAISADDNLLLKVRSLCGDGVSTIGERIKLSVKRHTLWCYLIPSFFIDVDKYWWLNQVTYASEFLV